MLKNKKAIELSVNFIVILILAIATFSLAVALTYNIFAKAYKLKADIDSETKAQIGSLLDSGEQVALPAPRLRIQAGRNDVFGLGILNTEPEEAVFSVIADKDSIAAYNADGEAAAGDVVSSAKEGIKLNYISSTKIGPNKKQIVIISASVGRQVRPDYVYSYTVRVKKGDEDYGLPKRIYVEVY